MDNFTSTDGNIVFNGRRLSQTTQAERTNRVDSAHNYNECETGDTYWDEFSATAEDADGSEYLLKWDFKQIKGQEPEEDDILDWDAGLCSVELMEC